MKITTIIGPNHQPNLDDYDRLLMAVPSMLTALEAAYGLLCREHMDQCGRYYRLEAEGKAEEQAECGRRIDRLQLRIKALDALRLSLTDL